MRLLAVVFAIGIAIGLTAFVADRANDGPKESVELPQLEGEATETAVAAAQASACAAERRVLEAAEEARFVLEGSYADPATLVLEQHLRAEPTLMTVTVAPDGSTYTISECRPPGP